LYQCPSQPHPTKTYGPPTMLSELIRPELLFLESRWTALVAYGGIVQLLHEVFRGYVRVQHTQRGLEGIAGKSLLAFTRGETSKLPVSDGEQTYTLRALVMRDLDRPKWFLCHWYERRRTTLVGDA
jgi:hypothetical protein